jgi:nitrogen regulatory protein P-II 1
VAKDRGALDGQCGRPARARERVLSREQPRKRRPPSVKLVIGIVRPEKANDVLEALYRAEVRGLSVSRVQGHGGELERVETYRGTTVKMALSEKVRFEVAVSDEFVDPAVDALCEGGRTGEVGDGKIFVIPLERAVRIRTGETDHGAVTPVGA